MIFGKKVALLTICLILAVAGLSPAAYAQLGGMDMYPQLRQSQSSQIPSGVNIPSITDENGANDGFFEFPEYSQPAFSDQFDILLDRKVDPDQYIVGPGDYLSVYLWGELDQQYADRVTPSGSIIIPTVGAVMVSDMTLAEASDSIRAAVNRSYNGLDVSITLLRPRRFRLFVTGVVERPSMYEANAMTRVSDLFVELDPVLFPEESEPVAIQALGEETDETEQQLITEADFPFELVEGRKAGLLVRDEDGARMDKRASSKRAITIYRGDEQIPVDLLRFEKLGDIDANPYVSGGDRVFVPGYMGDTFIEGEVAVPGVYEYKHGDVVRDLVGFGGGLTAVADSMATLVRFSPNGRDQIHIPIDLHDALVMHPRNPEYALQESDRLFIRTKYEYKELANVRVQGEVRFPGYYAITENVTRLTDIIALAGGFTGDANLDEAQIIQNNTTVMGDPDLQRLRLMPVEDMTDAEYEYFKMQSRTLQNVVIIDFTRLFTENDLSHDVILEDGDNIIIPVRREMVSVLGAVKVPGAVRVEPGADFHYYVEKAGGYNWNAKSRNIRIVKARTRQQLKPGGNTSIEGGDTILVPEKRPVDYWELLHNSIEVLANVATIVLIVNNVTNK